MLAAGFYESAFMSTSKNRQRLRRPRAPIGGWTCHPCSRGRSQDPSDQNDREITGARPEEKEEKPWEIQTMSQYYNIAQTSCPICKGKFQRWTQPVRCTGPCGRQVCPRHVDKIPYLCPDCKSAQAPFFSQSGGAAPVSDATGISQMIERASALYQDQRIAEAERAVDDIFVYIFEKKP